MDARFKKVGQPAYIGKIVAGRKPRGGFRSLPARAFEEHPDESDRPTFHADTIKQGVLVKLQAFMAEDRTKQAIRSEISRRTKRVEANVGCKSSFTSRLLAQAVLGANVRNPGHQKGWIAAE